MTQKTDVAIGVDVTNEGTHVVAMRMRPDGVNVIIYSQFHPLASPERKPLTLDELWRVFTRSGLSQFHQRDGVVEYKYEKCIEEFGRAIEAAHGIK